MIIGSSTFPNRFLFSLADYQVSLADATNPVCDKVRCDPKLTDGREIVRDAPRESSTETFNDWYEALIGKAAVGYVSASWLGARTRACV